MKEEFCSACVAGVAAIAGAGAATTSRKKRKTIFWLGISISIISLIVLVYLLMNNKSCSACA
jgi:hypothetical protein